MSSAISLQLKHVWHSNELGVKTDGIVETDGIVVAVRLIHGNGGGGHYWLK